MIVTQSPKIVLYINGSSDAIWYHFLQGVLSEIALVKIATKMDAIKNLQQLEANLIIVDAVTSGNAINLVTEIHKLRPLTPIIVVTTSPTWKRAREYFLAGATDYIRKSLDTELLRKTFSDFINNS